MLYQYSSTYCFLREGEGGVGLQLVPYVPDSLQLASLVCGLQL
jgi:hypothetical protein